MIREIGRKLVRCCENTATVGRISGCYFTVLRQFDSLAEIDALIACIRQISAEPCQIKEGSISVYLSVGMALYSETQSREGLQVQAEMRRMTDDVENISQQQLIENTGRIFHIFDELPLAYAVYKIVYGSGGGDAIVLYANRSFEEMTQLSLKDLIGKRVSNFFTLDANDWIFMAEKAGVDGKSIKGNFHDIYMDCDFEITAYPVIGPGFCAFTFQKKVEGR